MDQTMMARQLRELVGLRSSPVAVAFRERPPAGVPRVEAAGPSSCTYWKWAAEGRTFWTEASDHFNCPIGAYTHGVEMPAERVTELHGVLGTMFSLGYLRQEEVPGIYRREEGFGVAVYAPLADASFEPDLVLLRGNAREVMLLGEAAQAAGVGGTGMMGRPTCAALPQAQSTQRGVASLGCIGNRVYTGLADDELYFVLPGKHLAAVVEQLARIVQANRELETYHRTRMATVGARP